jgi:CheY-like chemotaxis protein
MSSSSAIHRILVAYDSPEVRKIVWEVLTLDGHVVDLCGDGVELLRQCRKARYSLLVVDVEMPGASGLEVIRKLRAEGMGVPVLLMTAGAPEPAARFALDVEGVVFLPKPFTPTALREAVASACALRLPGGA